MYKSLSGPRSGLAGWHRTCIAIFMPGRWLSEAASLWDPWGSCQDAKMRSWAWRSWDRGGQASPTVWVSLPGEDLMGLRGQQAGLPKETRQVGTGDKVWILKALNILSWWLSLTYRFTAHQGMQWCFSRAFLEVLPHRHPWVPARGKWIRWGSC